MADWGALERAVDGQVHRPGSPGYEEARRPALDQFASVRPAAVVACRGEGDVAEVVRFAAATGLRAVPRSGGHCFAGRSSTEGIVIDVGPLDGVVLDGGRARIGAGTRLGRVYEVLAAELLAIPAGCGPTVGVAGLALGGGLGILGRRHGLTSDRLVAARIVLAGGRVLATDAEHEPDLFWALRGAGGGQFGVVTELTFDPVPAPAATVFALDWPLRDAGAVARAWQAWAPAEPEEVAASLLVVPPADPEEPAVRVFGAVLAAEAEARARLAGLVDAAGADPMTAVARHAGLRDAKALLDGLDAPGRALGAAPPPAAPVWRQSASEFFARPMPPEGHDALLAHLAGARVHAKLDFMPWGGAYTRTPAGATAFPHRDAAFLLKHEVAAPLDASPGARARAREWLARSAALVAPWGTGGAYVNFPDPALADPLRAYHGANLERLRAIKARYDPGGAFSFAQALA
jgi:FAD/FMN-containing dehydrogenase